MKENKYDDELFFSQYRQMERSVKGLEGAGEWHELQKMLPDFSGKRVLDLGCGFGWHCRYAAEHGAVSVIGTDISEKMLAEARANTLSPVVSYVRIPMEDIDYPPASFDVVISSLAFHYVKSFGELCNRVYSTLASGGNFVFSVEHPIFTASGTQNWHCDEQGNPLHWPVDRYFTEGARTAVFLGEPVTKYHKTLTTYINTLITTGFSLTGLVEPLPEEHLQNIMPDEWRRPMMLLVSAKKASAE